MFHALIEALDRPNHSSSFLVMVIYSCTSTSCIYFCEPKSILNCFWPVWDTILSMCSCQNAPDPRPFPLMGRLARAINTTALTRLPRWAARAILAYSKYRHHQQTDAATAAAAETTTSASAAAAASSSQVSGIRRRVATDPKKGAGVGFIKRQRAAAIECHYSHT